MSKHYKYKLNRSWFTLQSARIIAQQIESMGYKKVEAGNFGGSVVSIQHDKKITPADQKFLNGYMQAISSYSYLIVDDE